ncbi:hypothetical protein N0V93_004129 [Gnomoniopsis smithogilvyi]|uniref:Major facilitator superfamily (MFS) profile domain-containing protein n=1 Tax=Gnomoniopsis smithogilvyi TaxID=1191159 RepID=A0A9W8YS93_9PEZI|nr:hypothetical protein N0V93_004129 [Gnomoniopsis smithogilvyi]
MDTDKSNSTKDDSKSFTQRRTTPHGRPGIHGFIKSIRCMYGKEAYDEKLAQLWDAECREPFEYPNKGKRVVLLISAILPYMIGCLDHTIIATLIPTFIEKFDRPADIGWYASSYFLPFALLMPTLGKCYSLWKIKWLFLPSLIFLISGSMLCGLAQKSGVFIMARVLSGTGAAGILQGSLRILAFALPGAQRIYMEGMGAVMMGACIMSGPLIGGVIADTVGWEWAFWINIPPTVLSFVIVLFFFPTETPRTALFTLPTMEKIKRLDTLGSLCLMISLACLITVLQDYSYSLTLTIGPKDIGIAVVAGLALACFLVQEALVRPDFALIPRSMISRRSVWSSSLLLFFVFAGFTNFVFFMSIFQQVVQAETAADSAIHMLPYVISATVTAAITSLGATIIRLYNPFFITGGVLFSVGLGLISHMNENVVQVTKFGYEVLVGSGVGLMVMANISPCHTDLPEKDHAIANGVTGLGGALGASIAVPVSSALFNRAVRVGIMALDVPLSVKIIAAENITAINQTVPDEYREQIVDLLVSSIQVVFLFGVGCAIAAAITAFVVPWKSVTVPGSSGGQDGCLPSWSKRSQKIDGS